MSVIPHPNQNQSEIYRGLTVGRAAMVRVYNPKKRKEETLFCLVFGAELGKAEVLVLKNAELTALKDDLAAQIGEKVLGWDAFVASRQAAEGPRTGALEEIDS